MYNAFIFDVASNKDHDFFMTKVRQIRDEICKNYTLEVSVKLRLDKNDEYAKIHRELTSLYNTEDIKKIEEMKLLFQKIEDKFNSEYVKNVVTCEYVKVTQSQQ